MGDIMFFILFIVVLGSTMFLPFVYTSWLNTFVNKHPKLDQIITHPVSLAVIVLGSFMGLMFAVVKYGSISRETSSAIPWEVWEEQMSYGYLSAFTGVGVNLIFLLWAFILPAQMYTWRMYKKSGTRPLYPYVINFLIGIILSRIGY